MNVSGILVVGGSICRVLRGSESLGGRPSNQAAIPGGSVKERPSRAWGEGEREGGGSIDLLCFTEV